MGPTFFLKAHAAKKALQKIKEKEFEMAAILLFKLFLLACYSNIMNKAF